MVEYVGIVGKKEDMQLDEMKKRICDFGDVDTVRIKNDFISMIVRQRRNEKNSVLTSNNIKIVIDGYVICDNINQIFDLYRKHGTSFAEHLNGTFNIFLYDGDNGKVIIANDKYGWMPLFYYCDYNYMRFSSQMFPILVDLKPELNWNSIAEFFAFGSSIGNKTLLHNIFLLPPATAMVYQNSQFKFQQYWEFRYHRNWNRKELLEKLRNIFINTVNQFSSDKKEKRGLLLSGGLDSRTILGAISSPVKTFSFGPDKSTEMKIAARVARKARVDNEQFILEPSSFLKWGRRGIRIGGGRILFNHFYNFQIIDRLEKAGIDRFVHGFGLGELLGGQKLSLKLFKIRSMKELEDYAYSKMNFGFHEQELQRLFLPQYYKKVKGGTRMSLNQELHKTNEDSIPDIYEHLIFRTFVRDVMISAAHRGRIFNDASPLYDNVLMDTVLQIPGEYRVQHKFYLDFFRHTFPKLSHIVYSNTGIAPWYPTPLQLWYSRGIEYYRGGITRARNLFKNLTKVSIENKSGNPDLGEWIRSKKEIRSYIEQTLLDDKAVCKNFLNETYIREIIERHMSYEKDDNPQIFILLSFELFLRAFVNDV